MAVESLRYNATQMLQRRGFYVYKVVKIRFLILRKQRDWKLIWSCFEVRGSRKSIIMLWMFRRFVPHPSSRRCDQVATSIMEKSIRIVDKKGKEGVNVRNTAPLPLQKKSSTDLDRFGTKWQFCSFSLRVAEKSYILIIVVVCRYKLSLRKCILRIAIICRHMISSTNYILRIAIICRHIIYLRQITYWWSW
jgi:hypothetical protein